MEYQIIYNGNTPIQIRFEPNFVNSRGTYNGKLGKAILKRLGVPGWSWTNSELVQNILDGSTYQSDSVENAQHLITMYLDHAYELVDYLEAIKESKGGD